MVPKLHINSNLDYAKFFQRFREVAKCPIPKSKINPHSHNAIALVKTQNTDPMPMLIQYSVPLDSTQFTSDPTRLVRVESSLGPRTIYESTLSSAASDCRASLPPPRYGYWPLLLLMVVGYELARIVCLVASI